MARFPTSSSRQIRMCLSARWFPLHWQEKPAQTASHPNNIAVDSSLRNGQDSQGFFTRSDFRGSSIQTRVCHMYNKLDNIMLNAKGGGRKKKLVFPMKRPSLNLSNLHQNEFQSTSNACQRKEQEKCDQKQSYFGIRCDFCRDNY